MQSHPPWENIKNEQTSRERDKEAEELCRCHAHQQQCRFCSEMSKLPLHSWDSLENKLIILAVKYFKYRIQDTPALDVKNDFFQGQVCSNVF